MIVQFAEYAALKKREQSEEQGLIETSGSSQIIELSARQEFAAYERAKARVQEAAAKLDW
ncbi:hypothetical protein [Ewingella americana]|uniref:Uncharacterized protein n=1 Tax=Ewingella americana TaxID=41202 RepID=A0A502G5E2_9GAMM|nr:hypothetical protein [Ewingella americana]TPG57078.1 hypothetical protein EAH77_21940 [Ewingella americana]